MAKKNQPPRAKHKPQRTCVVCRQKRDKRNLLRLVRTAEDGVVVDLTGKRNGRGAYICDQSACWQTLLHRPDVLGQALKTAVTASELEAIARYQPAQTNQTPVEEAGKMD